MSVEREILITILKLTRYRPISHSSVGKAAGIPTHTLERFLEKFVRSSLIKWKEKALEASSEQRVRIAFEALALGADFERVGRLLEWKEFEDIATRAFEEFGYYVIKNFRFKMKNEKRWEIDLLAFKHSLIVSVDCKQWRRNWNRANVIKTVEQHVERTNAFAVSLPYLKIKAKLRNCKQVMVAPIVLSLLPSQSKLHLNTPIVPVLKLQSFLNEMPAHIISLTHFVQKIDNTDRKITDY